MAILVLVSFFFILSIVIVIHKDRGWKTCVLIAIEMATIVVDTARS